MAHQYMLKIFHDPQKKPSGPPSYILNVRSLITIYLSERPDTEIHIVKYYKNYTMYST